MISVEDARITILNQIRKLPVEKISLDQALGRYLAENIASAIDVPSSDNSAMDGYALRAGDITESGTKLEVIYDLPAGSLPKQAVKAGQAVRIMTGAPIPEGADTVVMREQTHEAEHTVVINTIPKRGDHIRRAAEDIAAGQVILKAGTRLGPAQIGLLASVRKFLVHVHQQPVVAILATGDEVADLDDPFSAGMVSSSNSYTLISMVKECGAIPLYLGIARDSREDLISKMQQARRADLLISSGGVSMGDYDLVKEVMQDDGNKMEFWQVCMKPGKPLAFGHIAGIPAIGLPGNPVSTMTSFYQFVRPAIRKMLGAENLLLPSITATLNAPIKKRGDRVHYVRGQFDAASMSVTTTGDQGSGILSSMARGNCFIICPAEATLLEPGEVVNCELFAEI